MIATDTILTPEEREWLAQWAERLRLRGMVLVGASRTVEGLEAQVGDIVLCDEAPAAHGAGEVFAPLSPRRGAGMEREG